MSHFKNAGIIDDRKLKNCERRMIFNQHNCLNKLCQILPTGVKLSWAISACPQGKKHIDLALAERRYVRLLRDARACNTAQVVKSEHHRKP